MSFEKILRYTGLFGNNSNSAQPKEMNIDGDCTITNYDPRTGNKPSGSVKVEAYNNSIFVEEGAKSDKSPEVADFSEKKAKVLEEIAGLDNTDKGLSKKDILKIDKSFIEKWKEWGVKDLAVDHKNGVVTVKWGENDVLRIDFSKMAKERATQGKNEEAKPVSDATSKSSLKTHEVESGETLGKIARKYGISEDDLAEWNDIKNKDSLKAGQVLRLGPKSTDAKTDQATTKPASDATSKSTPKTHEVKSGETLGKIARQYGISQKDLIAWNRLKNPDSLRLGQVLNLEPVDTIKVTEKIIKNFKGGEIPIDKVHDIKTVAQYTGLSEDYIRDILVGIEGRNNWPLCKAEYDGVKDKTHPNGYLTIAFGHTSLSGEPDVYEGMKITEKQAYQILANDIVAAQKYIKNKLRNNGIEQDDVPKSIQNAMIDAYFNKGPEGISSKFLSNLKMGDYMSAALETWYVTDTTGLFKRNMYRFIEAIKDIPNSADKKKGIIDYKDKHENDLLKAFAKDHKAKVAWNNMCISYRCKATFV